MIEVMEPEFHLLTDDEWKRLVAEQRERELAYRQMQDAIMSSLSVPSHLLTAENASSV